MQKTIAKLIEKTPFMQSDTYRKYRDYGTVKEEVIDFFGSLARPFREVFDAVRNPPPGVEFESEARKSATSIIGATDPDQVFFGRNTSEAVSIAFWLAAVEQGTVLTSDAEYESIPRVFTHHLDHGNTRKNDQLTTWADEIVDESPIQLLEDVPVIPTGVRVITAPLLDRWHGDELVAAVNDRTKLLVFSHVVRGNGRILDIVEIARRVRQKNPATMILVDGAQALGNLPRVSFPDLERAGIDFYAVSPHKSLGSYPLGILYVSGRALHHTGRLHGKTVPRQIILKGMIPPAHGIRPTVNAALHPNRFVSFVTAIRTLREKGYNQGIDFSRKSNHVSKVKGYFIDCLRQTNAVILGDQGKCYSPTMLAFRFPYLDNSVLAQGMRRNHALCAYMPEMNAIRVGFDVENTRRQVDLFFGRMREQKKHLGATAAARGAEALPI